MTVQSVINSGPSDERAQTAGHAVLHSDKFAVCREQGEHARAVSGVLRYDAEAVSGA